MNAPDKIYLERDKETEKIDFRWGDRPVVHSAYEHIEYIRKGALLEWAKEAHDSGPIKDSADNGDAWSIGYLSGMADIIDKLNSM